MRIDTAHFDTRFRNEQYRFHSTRILSVLEFTNGTIEQLPHIESNKHRLANLRKQYSHSQRHKIHQ